MKLSNNISFPYPVLGINDDVYPLLGVDNILMPEPVVNAMSFVFSVDLKQDNATITNLIEVGLAEYTCEIDCPKTFYRRCLHSAKPHFDIEINRKDVAGHIDFKCYVSVKKPFLYTNPQFHEDYQGCSFELECGDILVAFSEASYNVSLKYDKLYVAGSFMQVSEDSKAERTWFNLEDEKVTIMFPHELFEQYKTLNDELNYMEIIHSSVVFNALVYAINNIGNEQYSGRMWCDAINTRFRTEQQFAGLDIENPQDVYEIVQIMLGDPYKRLFERLQNMQQENEEE